MQTPEACRCNVRPKLQRLAPGQARSMGPGRHNFTGQIDLARENPSRSRRGPQPQNVMFFLKNPSQLSEENGNTSDFPAHSELQIVIGFSKTYGIVMGFLEKPIAFLGTVKLPDRDGFFWPKPLSQMGLATKNVIGFLKTRRNLTSQIHLAGKTRHNLTSQIHLARRTRQNLASQIFLARKASNTLVYLGSNRFAMSKTRSRT